MATFVGVSEATYPTEYNDRQVLPMEGKSLLPVFQGKQREGHETLYWQIAPNRHRTVRNRRWKLVSPSKKDPWKLYDLEADRFEMNNLADQLPEKVNELKELYLKGVIYGNKNKRIFLYF